MNTSNELEQAYTAFEKGKYAIARTIFERLEPELKSQAHLYLGWMYEQGLGGAEDIIKAEHQFRYLAQAGDLDGKYYLAALLQRKGDVRAAATLYEEASNSGHVSAAYWAYCLYSEELSHERGAEQKAQKYLVDAAARGHIFARRDLALRVATNGSSFEERLLARLRYLACKLQGFILILRNSEDMRVR